MSTQPSQVGAFFNALRGKDNFAEIVLIYALRTYGRLTDDRTVSVDRNHVLEFWRDCIGRCNQWYAVNYVKQEETWDTGWGDAIAQGIQQERIRVGGTIKRVFVVDDEDEARRLRRAMREQENIGIQVRWLLKNNLLRNKLIEEHIKVLGTLDFAIVDDSWFYKGHLDKSRGIFAASGIKDNELVERSKFVFHEAFTRGNLVDSVPPNDRLQE